MKLFIKNSYLFLILFLLIWGKNYLCKQIYVNSLKVAYINSLNDYQVYSNAKVLYQNPYKYNEEVYIKTGNSVQENDYVINNTGIIGIINKISKDYTTVTLLTSNKVVMQVKVNDCYGILENGTIKNISSTCNIAIGDNIYTSDLAYINKSYLIGTIENIKADKNNISSTYMINYISNNLNNIKVVSREVS